VEYNRHFFPRALRKLRAIEFQPMGSARSLGRGIRDIASVRCLVASAINCTEAGCIPSLYGGRGGGGGNSSSPFSSGRGSRLKLQRERRLGGMILYLKEQLSHIS
jgi:hypothetical protein